MDGGKITVFIVGDSTVSAFNDPYYIPRCGYGEQIGYYLDGVRTVNLAVSGRSSLSFLTDSFGNYDRLKRELKAGDYLVIGFGHNDEKNEPARYTNPLKSENDASAEGGVSFRKNLYDNYIALARSRGAVPILCTPVVRLDPHDDYGGKSGHITRDVGAFRGGDYPRAIRELGAAAGVTVIDLTASSKARYLALGHERAADYHAFTGALGGKRTGMDSTHLNLYGARAAAYDFICALARTGLPLAERIRKDAAPPSYDKDYPEAVNLSYREPLYEPFSPARSSSLWDIKADGWYGTVFGDVGGQNNISPRNFTLKGDGNAFTVGGKGGFGKTGSTDGIAAVFRQLPAGKNFEISAEVSGDIADENQNAFGIMLRDSVYIDRDDPTIKDNYVAAGAYHTGERWNVVYCRENGGIVPSGRTAESLSGRTHTLLLKKINQSVTAEMDGESCTYTDFDFVQRDNEFVYICLFAAKNTVAEFKNVKFSVTGDSLEA